MKVTTIESMSAQTKQWRELAEELEHELDYRDIVVEAGNALRAAADAYDQLRKLLATLHEDAVQTNLSSADLSYREFALRVMENT